MEIRLAMEYTAHCCDGSLPRLCSWAAQPGRLLVLLNPERKTRLTRALDVFVVGDPTLEPLVRCP
jgi:hypothetical protein